MVESFEKSNKIIIGWGFGIMVVPYSAKYWQDEAGEITLAMYLQV